MLKFLITGSNGFIGSRLLTKLKNVNIHNLSSDLRDIKAVEKEVQQFDPTHVIHLGALSEVAFSFDRQLDYAYIDYVGSINLFESITKHCTNFQHLLFPSTMEVYGWQPISDLIKNKKPFEPEVFDEFTKPNPNSPYAVAKIGCEEYLGYLGRAKDFPYTIIRQTNTFGRTNNDFFVTEAIITRMLKNKDKIEIGEGRAYRNFLYIDDLLDAWLTIIENKDKVIKKKYTLGPNNALSIYQYAKLIAKRLNWNGIIEQNKMPDRPGEIYWLNSDYKLFAKDTGWYPKYTLEQGIDKTIEYWADVIRKN